MMEFAHPVSPQVFEALHQVDIQALSECLATDVRPILPTLVRMSLIKPLESTQECVEARREILKILTGIEHVNSIVALLSIDFHALELDVKKEHQLRQKGGSQFENLYPTGLAHEFERSDSIQRIRLVISELFNVFFHTSDNKDNLIRPSDLFDNAVYLSEVCDVLCIALAELPAILVITEIAEALIKLKYGPEIICWVLANFPHHFRSVCVSLISNAEKQDEESAAGRMRNKAIRMLCQMNPTQSLLVRAKCIEMCRMPALAIMLSLDQVANADIVGFVSGLLLGSDQSVRTWFAMFMRNGQKKKVEVGVAVQLLREEFLKQLTSITQDGNDGNLSESSVVTASAFLRLYCALRCIAGIKFHDEEVTFIVDLLTKRPPASRAGIRFVSLALCMIIACPSLITLPEHERKAILWVQWLVKGENYFESVSGTGFGEMLLLMAIHFHSNQLSAVCDLVCTTLGMKVQTRSNNMTRLKQIFTQEIFTEQVVAAHAVKVPVTSGLHAGMTGYLPVHCIYHLLKSRAFAKHKVPIHNWLYKQICSTVPPLHPVLPGLVEVYVSSILAPPGTKAHDQVHTNRPLSEQQIRAIFQNSVFGRAFDSKQSVPDEGSGVAPSLTAQLLLLYYLMLYEDMRLTNGAALSAAGRQIFQYSAEFMSDLPIKYLLQQAQKDQASYGSLFSSLLRLLATHFPHLSLVEDWLDEDESPTASALVRSIQFQPTIDSDTVRDAMENLETNAARAARTLRRLLAMSPTDVWPHAELIISYFPVILGQLIPQCVQELFKEVWLRLNMVLPRSLWVMTINSLLPKDTQTDNLTQENIAVDPLQVLRVDQRVFRSAPALTIILRVLQASLAASRSHLARHILDHPLTEMRGQLTSDAEREELRLALISTQESLAVQILLECCLETREDLEEPGQHLALREVRSIICSYLHQVFISDPALAKLVHFQGYPRELLPITVAGIPSMHICLDFIPELLSQPVLDKQVFAVDLASHLSIQYAVPKSLSVARLTINTLSTLLSVLPSSTRCKLFCPVLPSLVRICEAFPPLADDTISLLTQLGRVASAQAAIEKLEVNERLCVELQNTFQRILRRAVLSSNTFN